MAKAPTNDGPSFSEGERATASTSPAPLVDASGDPSIPQRTADPIPAAAAQQQAQLVVTQQDLQLLREQDANQRRLLADDRARAALGTVSMEVVNPFTLHDDASPMGRVVRKGERIEVSLYDVQAMTGRCRLVDELGEPDKLDGPTVTRG